MPLMPDSPINPSAVLLTHGASINVDLDTVYRLAGQGMTLQQVADYLGIPYGTFAHMMRHNPAVAEAARKGLADTITNLTEVLKSKAAAGDTRSLTYWLERRAGWTLPKQDVTVTVAPATPLTIDGHVTELAASHAALLDSIRDAELIEEEDDVSAEDLAAMIE